MSVTVKNTDREYSQLRSVRRQRQHQLSRQDRKIKRLMDSEGRERTAEKRKVNRQIKLDRVIGHIQAIADECAINADDVFDDFDALVRFLAIRGVMSWPRVRFSDPTHKEKSFIAEAIRRAQLSGLITIVTVDRTRKIINNFPTLPSHGFFTEDDLFVFGRHARREFQAA